MYNAFVERRSGKSLTGGNFLHVRLVGLIAAVCAVPLLAADDDFQKVVSPFLSNSCQPCHNAQLPSGELDLTPFLKPASLTAAREGWEMILQKLRSGEMPPKDIPRPPQSEYDALIGYVQGEFDKADRAVKPDPGRVTARRLNRSEYSNTVRDLLGVNFRAESDFPTDDSSYGFDTIGSVLTVSPVLMEKYVARPKGSLLRRSAPTRCRSPSPGSPRQQPYPPSRSGGLSETTHRFAFDADYSIKVRFAGVRPPDSKPMVLGLWLDGKQFRSLPVENIPAGDTRPGAGIGGAAICFRWRPHAARGLYRRRVWQKSFAAGQSRSQEKQVSANHRDRGSLSDTGGDGPAGKRFSSAIRTRAPRARRKSWQPWRAALTGGR